MEETEIKLTTLMESGSAVDNYAAYRLMINELKISKEAALKRLPILKKGEAIWGLSIANIVLEYQQDKKHIIRKVKIIKKEGLVAVKRLEKELSVRGQEEAIQVIKDDYKYCAWLLIGILDQRYNKSL